MRLVKEMDINRVLYLQNYFQCCVNSSKYPKIKLLTRLQCLHLFSQISPQVRHFFSRIFGGKGAKLTPLFESLLSAALAISTTLQTGQIVLPSKINKLLIIQQKNIFF